MSRVENPHIFDSKLPINDSYDCLADGIPIARHFDRLVKDKKTAPFNEYFDDTIVELLKKQEIPQDSTIIDLGCGSGKTLDRLGHELSPAPKRLIGIDKSKEMVAVAKENFPWLEIQEANMSRALEGKKRVADIITSINAVHYLPSLDDVSETYKSAFRLLKSEGIFILGTGDDDSTFGYRNMNKDQAKEWIKNGRKAMDWSMPDENGKPAFRLKFYPYLNEEHLDALEKAGFSPIQTFRQYPPGPKIFELSPRVYKLLEEKPVFIFFVAFKPSSGK